MRQDVWLDVDPAAGIPNKDVDDGLAMIQAFHSPELCVRGVSVVFGNAPLEPGLEIGREVVARFGPPGLQVAAGAASADQLGARSEAVDALAAELARRELVILALGPVTNVASLLQLHPELHERIARILIVAARRPGQHFRTGEKPHVPFRDFNFESDPDAMAVLLESDVELVFAPWEVSSHLFLRAGDLAELGASGPSGAWIAEKSRSWLRLWRRSFDVDGFNPFDTLAVGYATHPELMHAFEARVWIDSGPDDCVEPDSDPADAATKPYLLVEPVQAADTAASAGRRARYCYRPDDLFKEILVERLKRAAD